MFEEAMPSCSACSLPMTETEVYYLCQRCHYRALKPHGPKIKAKLFHVTHGPPDKKPLDKEEENCGTL